MIIPSRSNQERAAENRNSFFSESPFFFSFWRSLSKKIMIRNWGFFYLQSFATYITKVI